MRAGILCHVQSLSSPLFSDGISLSLPSFPAPVLPALYLPIVYHMEMLRKALFLDLLSFLTSLKPLVGSYRGLLDMWVLL